MPKKQFSEDLLQRFPHLDKLSITIIKHLLESIIGEAAIEELKRPNAEKQVADTMAQLSQALKWISIIGIRIKVCEMHFCNCPFTIYQEPAAIWTFYNDPNGSRFRDFVLNQLKSLFGR